MQTTILEAMPKPSTSATSTLQNTVLTNQHAASVITRLAKQCKSLSIAVAWTTPNPVFNALRATRRKWRRVIVGTSLYQTSPDVVDMLCNLHNARCMPPTGTAMFHPKVYLFELTDQMCAALVGSHNLTRAGMAHNIETSILLQGPAEDPTFKALARFIDQAWRQASPVDNAFCADYRANHAACKSACDRLSTFTRLPRQRATRSNAIIEARQTLPATWAALVQVVNQDTHSKDGKRLRMLAHARELFNTPFADLPLAKRKMLAGMDPDWGLFGFMTGHGDFHTRINRSPALIGRAIDAIPLTGPIIEEHYRIYVALFRAAFKGASHGAGLASGTRLLALKRPDVFVPFNSANKKGLAAAFGQPQSTNLDTYWHNIIAPMQLLDWWQRKRPRTRHEAAIWDGRAALLDSLYFEAKQR